MSKKIYILKYELKVFDTGVQIDIHSHFEEFVDLNNLISWLFHNSPIIESYSILEADKWQEGTCKKQNIRMVGGEGLALTSNYDIPPNEVSLWHDDENEDDDD